VKTYEEEYFDPVSGVMKNKLGIDDFQKLRTYEYYMTQARSNELSANPIKGSFDLDHLKKIHEYLFGDIYDWAGKPRTVDIAKMTGPTTETPFAAHEDFGMLDFGLQETLKESNYLKGITRDETVKALTKTYVILNTMHPFPEGNGRATQLFMSQLANEADYNLDFKMISARLWNSAARDSMPQHDFKTGEQVIKGSVKPIMKIFDAILKDRFIEKSVEKDSKGPER
jgi:cell filamentation protein